jgi:hypothetical protein
MHSSDFSEGIEETDYSELSPVQLQGSALAYLLEGDDEEAADALARCVVARVFEEAWFNSSKGWMLTVNIRAPRAVYAQVRDDNVVLNYAASQGSEDFSALVAREKIAGRIREAMEAVITHDATLHHIHYRAHTADVSDKHLLADLIAQTFGGDISNQAPLAREARFWNNLRFRSASEIQIAEALDEAGVMFFPLCRARVTLGKQRVTREPDFLICHQGKWGVLEVDGGPFHPATRTTEDHERDRLFRAHGVRVVEHFDAEQCYQHSALVVIRFLELLRKNG